MPKITFLHMKNFISPVQIRNHLMIFQTVRAADSQYQLRYSGKRYSYTLDGISG